MTTLQMFASSRMGERLLHLAGQVASFRLERLLVSTRVLHFNFYSVLMPWQTSAAPPIQDAIDATFCILTGSISSDMIVKYCEVTILEVEGSISVGLASCGICLGCSNFLDYDYDIGMHAALSREVRTLSDNRANSLQMSMPQFRIADVMSEVVPSLLKLHAAAKYCTTH
jgi:hypothetical protein